MKTKRLKLWVAIYPAAYNGRNCDTSVAFKYKKDLLRYKGSWEIVPVWIEVPKIEKKKGKKK